MFEVGLEELRERIRQLDLEVIAKAAERVNLTRQLGEIKRRHNVPTVDYAQERIVLDRACEAAKAKGLEPALAEDLFASLIRAAVIAQDEDSLRVSAAGVGQTAVIAGGRGRMGGWLSRFLSTLGYTTLALDPLAGEESERARSALITAELVVCSTPPMTTAQLYADWSRDPPKGLIVDIASIKTPLIEPIRALQKAGAHVGSIHPLFGPSTVLLRGADVVICDTGDVEAAASMERLFQPTSARLVRMPLERHDEIMADLLSLSHASAIAVALALPATEHPVSSTTFRALKSLAGSVVRESSEVYYEIQVMNPHSLSALRRLRAAVDQIVDAVSARDVKSFAALMQEGRTHTHL